MLNLSDGSLKKVLECLESQDDQITIFDFIKCSFAINQVAVKHGFDKVIGAKLRLFKCFDHIPGRHAVIPPGDLKVYADVGPEEPGVKQDEEGDLHFYGYIPMQQVVPQAGGSVNQAVIKVLTDILQKVKTVKFFELHRFTLDTEFLDVLKQFSKELRTVNDLQLQSCLIAWTEDELMEFLMLFDRLDLLDLSGTFKSPIITDEHLSLIRKHVYIANGSEGILHFPGITSQICDIGTDTRKLQSVSMAGISTAISFDTINQFAEHMHDQKENAQLDFGILESSEAEHARIILAQRKSNTIWRIIEQRGGMVTYVVTIKGGATYSFSMKKPYRTPNLLEEVEQLTRFGNILMQEDVHGVVFSHVENYLINLTAQIDEYERRMSRNSPSPINNEEMIQEQNQIPNEEDVHDDDDVDLRNALDEEEDEEEDAMIEEDLFDEDGLEDDIRHWRRDILQKLVVTSRRSLRLLADTIEGTRRYAEEGRASDVE